MMISHDKCNILIFGPKEWQQLAGMGALDPQEVKDGLSTQPVTPHLSVTELSRQYVMAWIPSKLNKEAITVQQVAQLLNRKTEGITKEIIHQEWTPVKNHYWMFIDLDCLSSSVGWSVVQMENFLKIYKNRLGSRWNIPRPIEVAVASVALAFFRSKEPSDPFRDAWKGLCNWVDVRGIFGLPYQYPPYTMTTEVWKLDASYCRDHIPYCEYERVVMGGFDDDLVAAEIDLRQTKKEQRMSVGLAPVLRYEPSRPTSFGIVPLVPHQSGPSFSAAVEYPSSDQ